jgi:IMP dehydrogenase
MVVNPVTISPDAPLSEALALMKPTASPGSRGRASQWRQLRPWPLVGILTNRDVRFASDPNQKIHELMTHENLVTVKESVEQTEAKRCCTATASRKLVVVDGDGRCVGLITVKDIEKSQLNPHASKDEQGRCAQLRPPPWVRMGSSAPSA